MSPNFVVVFSNLSTAMTLSRCVPCCGFRDFRFGIADFGLIENSGIDRWPYVLWVARGELRVACYELRVFRFRIVDCRFRMETNQNSRICFLNVGISSLSSVSASS